MIGLQSVDTCTIPIFDSASLVIFIQYLCLSYSIILASSMLFDPSFAERVSGENYFASARQEWAGWRHLPSDPVTLVVTSQRSIP